MSIRIAIADDHPMIIGGLRNMLSDCADIELIATYPNGTTLLEGLQQRQPDVLLLDIQLPDQTGDELAAIIIKKYPEVKILVLTNFNSILYVQNMLHQGVHGYLIKTTEQETMLEAIETVYNGGSYIDATLREKMEQYPVKNEAQYGRITLTLREKDILQLVVQGKGNQDIAEQLFLSKNTVKKYRARIFMKLDVKNMAELTRKAMLLGLVY